MWSGRISRNISDALRNKLPKSVPYFQFVVTFVIVNHMSNWGQDSLAVEPPARSVGLQAINEELYVKR